jgi:hypothetical protein
LKRVLLAHFTPVPPVPPAISRIWPVLGREKTAADILATMRARGWQLWVDDRGLLCLSPALAAADRRRISRHLDELRALLEAEAIGTKREGADM